MIVTTAFLLVLASLDLVTSTTVFMPFGTSYGDSTMHSADDDFQSDNINVDLPFFGAKYDKIFVNTNGDISFNRSFTTYTPSDFPISRNGVPIIAPFWADVDIRYGGEIFYRETTDNATLQQFTREVKDTNLDGINFFFEAGWVYVVTWNNVTFFGASEIGKMKRNTFQLVLGLDVTGNQSIAIFNYDRLEWTTGTASDGDGDTGLGGTSALVGFDAGDGVNYYKVSGSKTSAVLQLNQQSNVNIPGKWMFKISDANVSEVTTPKPMISVQPSVREFDGEKYVQDGQVTTLTCSIDPLNSNNTVYDMTCPGFQQTCPRVTFGSVPRGQPLECNCTVTDEDYSVSSNLTLRSAYGPSSVSLNSSSGSPLFSNFCPGVDIIIGCNVTGIYPGANITMTSTPPGVTALQCDDVTTGCTFSVTPSAASYYTFTCTAINSVFAEMSAHASISVSVRDCKDRR